MMSNTLEMELVRETLGVFVKAKKWLQTEELTKELKCQSKEIQSAIGILFKGGYILRTAEDSTKKTKTWQYRFNTVLDIQQVLELSTAALTSDDFLELSPVPLGERQSFKYQQRSEVFCLKEAVDNAKALGDIQLENLEALAISSAMAMESYISQLEKKDKKLASLRQMSQRCEKSFWDYAQKLPRI
jgi:hypothetical protein